MSRPMRCFHATELLQVVHDLTEKPFLKAPVKGYAKVYWTGCELPLLKLEVGQVALVNAHQPNPQRYRWLVDCARNYCLPKAEVSAEHEWKVTGQKRTR